MMHTFEIFKAYITATANLGVKEVFVQACDSAGVVREERHNYGVYHHGEGKEWHRTRDAAVIRWEVLRTAKIISLQKQIAKLEAMKF